MGAEPAGKVNKRAERLAGPDLLRCIAMMMIVVLHYLGKGNLLPSAEDGRMLDITGVIAWAMEAFCAIAVNIYMLISGYFLSTSHFKLSRLISLYVQLWIYSAGVGLLGAALGLVPAEELTTYYFLRILLPVSMEHYWFLTAYFFLYLLLPLLSRAVTSMNKKQMLFVIGILLFFHSILKTILPFRLDTDSKGYTFLWYLVVYLIAAYLRKFSPEFLQKKGRCLLLWLAGSFGVLAELILLRVVYDRTGSMSFILGVPLEYNHLLLLLASLGFFGLLVNASLPEGISRCVRFLAPYTLGVYLLHENLSVRYLWQAWLGAGEVSGPAELIGRTLLAAILVFAIGITVDIIRKFIQDKAGMLLIRIPFFAGIAKRVRSADALFAEN